MIIVREDERQRVLMCAKNISRFGLAGGSLNFEN